MSDSLWHHGLQCARLSCPSLCPGACSDSSPFNQWCHPTISSSVAHISSCPQSFSASGSFSMSLFFTSCSLSIGASASALPMNSFRIDWFDLLLSKGLWRVFSSTTSQKHQFFGAQLSLWSKSHIHTWPLEKPYFDYTDVCWQSYVSAFWYAA